MKQSNLKTISIFFLLLISLLLSCKKDNNIEPNEPRKIIVFHDDFRDSSNWEITDPWDSLNNISIINNSMIACVVSKSPAMLGSTARIELNDSLYLDTTITRFGMRINLNEGDLHYCWNWPPHGNNGIYFNLEWGYYKVGIPTWDCNRALPIGNEYIAEYNNEILTLTIDGVEYIDDYFVAGKHVGGYAVTPFLEIWMEGYFIEDTTYIHKVIIDEIEFYIYK